MRSLKQICAIYLAGMILYVSAGFLFRRLEAQNRPALANTWQIKPQAVPTTLTDVSSLGTNIPANTDLYVCQMRLNALTANGTDMLFTMQDKQATPVLSWDGYPVSAGTIYERIAPNPDGCAWYPGGISLKVSGTGTLNIALSGRY